MARINSAEANALERWILPLVEGMTEPVLFGYRSDLRERLYKLSRAEELTLHAIETEVEIRVRKHEAMKYGSVVTK